MDKITYMIELLAPAKDKICAIAAINYGADALYIGASNFGARKNVPNSVEDIKEVVEYAHKFNVKVYVAINTILTDEEIKKAKKLILKLTEIGVDAFIIQDMGLLEIIKNIKDSRPIYIHASTQCDSRTVEKVKFLQDAGFSRVILARELSVEQIQKIKNNTNVELEAFIHGALCVSYSGQCYLSHLIGGRSANKGECAQPCRKKYSLIDDEGNFLAEEKHLLSLKDFNASEHLKGLAEAGITSFKIEGRLKDINYVKNVVGYYRNLIDDLGLQKKSAGKVLFDFEPDLKKSFNRGFTNYFVDGKRKDIYNFDSPSSKGEYLGEVIKAEKDHFELKSPFTIRHSPLASQDGLCFHSDGKQSGCLVNKIIGNKIYPNKMDGIKKGLKIFRNFDSEFEKKLNASKTSRKLKANIYFDLGTIKAIDENNNSTEIKYEFEELAQNKEKSKSNITTQLKKAGETDFIVETVEIKTDKIPFLPVSKINELRRELLDKLIQERLKNYSNKQIQKQIEYPNTYTKKELDYQDNILNSFAEEFYKKCGCEVKEKALESSNYKQTKERLAMTTKHCLKYTFNLCKSPKKLYLIDEKGKKYRLNFNCQKCEMEIFF